MEESAILFDKKGRTKKLYVEINDGYAIRCLMEFLYATISEVNIIFTPKGISIKRGDAENLIVIDAFIEKGRLPYYIYKAKEEEIIFGASLETLRSDTQVLARKEGIRLTMYEGDKTLYFEPIGSDSSTDSLRGISKIRHKKVPNIRYPIPEYKISESEPTCVIPVNKFCKMCTKFNKVRNSSTVLMKAYVCGVKFRSCNPGNIRNNTHLFGIISESGGIEKAQKETPEDSTPGKTENADDKETPKSSKKDLKVKKSRI